MIWVTYASGKGVEERDEALLELPEKTGCKNLSAVTWDCEDEAKINGKKFTSLWKWLMTT